MLPLDTIALFFAASVTLGLAPGPDNLFVLTQSALHGRAAGVLVTLGLCSGLLIHTAAVALGVAVIFQTSAFAFNLLKGVGAAYLLYLAWRALRAEASEIPRRDDGTLDASALYLRGVIMNLTNPKVAIFFLAFLPQFADPAHGALTPQILLLGALFIVATLLVFGMIAWGAGTVGRRLRESPGIQRIMNRVAGTLFAALALRLITAER